MKSVFSAASDFAWCSTSWLSRCCTGSRSDDSSTAGCAAGAGADDRRRASVAMPPSWIGGGGGRQCRGRRRHHVFRRWLERLWTWRFESRGRRRFVSRGRRRFDNRLGGCGVDLAGHAVARGRHRLQDHREQAVDVDRHRQVLGGCEAAARLGSVARAPEAAGDEEDRRVARLWLAPQVLGQAEAVSVGQHGVDHDRVGRAHGDAAPGPRPFGLGGELVVRLLECVPDAALQDRVALHDQDVTGHGVEAAY